MCGTITGARLQLDGSVRQILNTLYGPAPSFNLRSSCMSDSLGSRRPGCGRAKIRIVAIEKRCGLRRQHYTDKYYLLFRFSEAGLVSAQRWNKWGYKTYIFGLFFLFNLTLSELLLPTTWMFLGLAYNKLDEYKRRRAEHWNTGRQYGFALGK
jgi:hypothetical protein